jgi:pSer/pThr/pTyr-binding forkhead associated (FHA) protein
MPQGAVPAETARELKERIEAERLGEPFVVYREGSGDQVVMPLGGQSGRLTIGRSETANLTLASDDEASRVHAELELVGGEWVLVDDGLSRNGSFVNGERVVGRRRLRDGDAIRLGATLILYRSPAELEAETVPAKDRLQASDVTETQRRVLVALCRPFGSEREFVAPASNREIAEEVFLSVDAVKANLRALFDRFEIGELAQNKNRIRLAELALRSGVISPRDLEG